MTRPSYTHLILECYNCYREILNDKRAIRKALKLAAKACNLHVVKHAIHTFQPQGLTGYVLLEESHISIHTWPEKRFALVDVLSCAKFDVDRLEECIRSSLHPKDVEVSQDSRRRKR